MSVSTSTQAIQTMDMKSSTNINNTKSGTRIYKLKQINGKKIIMIAFTYDIDTYTASYGACVHNRPTKGSTYNKKSHWETAIGRLEKSPVIMEVTNEILQDFYKDNPELRSELPENMKQSITCVRTVPQCAKYPTGSEILPNDIAIGHYLRKTMYKNGVSGKRLK